MPDWERTARDGCRLLNAFREAGVRQPHLSIAEDGEFNLFWSGDGLYVDVGCPGDGTWSYYAKAGEWELKSDQAWFDEVPDSLVRMLKGERVEATSA